MDSVTQIVLGAAVGEATLGRKVGNKAMLWGAVAGTIPDLDVIGRLFLDDITALEWHRGFSHSLVFSLLFAPLFGFLIQRFSKDKSAGFAGWTKLMFLGFVTHPLLDCHTTWGTQFLWPFDLRIAYNNIFVVDPLYTVPFAVLLIMAMRQPRESAKRRKYNNLGLVISSSYMVVTLILKAVTFPVFTTSLHKNNIPYERISTRPSPLNSVLWTANVETRDSFYIGYYSIFDGDDLVSFHAFPKRHKLLDGHKDDDQIKRLIHVTQNWYLLQNRGDSLILCDLRFGELGIDNPDNRFVFSHLIHQDQPSWIIEQIDPPRAEVGPMFKKLWDRIIGRQPILQTDK